jgi:hypothetical protein
MGDKGYCDCDNSSLEAKGCAHCGMRFCCVLGLVVAWLFVVFWFLCGVVWCGVVWCGVVWCGVVWCGVVWCGVVWCGVVWCVLQIGCVLAASTTDKGGTMGTVPQGGEQTGFVGM